MTHPASIPFRPGRLPRRRLLLGLAGLCGTALAAATAPSRTWRVAAGSGPSLAEVARLARDGDTIELAAGDHHGQTAVLTQRGLWLHGAGGGATLHADGAHAEGKAIVVVRGEVTIAGVAFRGCRVPHGNGAGVRFEAGRLRVERCRFVDNEMGLITANDPAQQLEVIDCLFADAPRHPGPLHHLLYAGRIGMLTVQGSHFANGWRGHLLKSRALRNLVRGNAFVDGPTGEASYEVEFPEGGEIVLTGNVVVQGPTSGNAAIVSVGAEGGADRATRLTMVHNTLVNTGAAPATFLHWWAERLQPGARAWLANNVVAGTGHWTLPPGSDGGGNARLALQQLRDADAGDAGPAADGAGWPAAVPLPGDVAPPWWFSAPLGARPAMGPARWPGAVQR
jgi:hypothetical protein